MYLFKVCETTKARRCSSSFVPTGFEDLYVRQQKAEVGL